MGFGLSGVTDAIGLTDFGGAATAQRQSNKALQEQMGLSRELVDWWRTNAAPYQKGLMERGMGLYDEAAPTEADYSRALGQASSDVAGAFGRARDTTARGLMRYGVDPTSGRFRSAMTGLAGEQAAADAAARNAARGGLRDTAFARKSQALGLGASLNAPNYGLVGQGMSGLSSAAGQYGNLASQLSAGNQAAIGGLIQGAGAAYGGFLARPPVKTSANGGEINSRGYGLSGHYADGKQTRGYGLSGAYANGGVAAPERFMGNAERMEPPPGSLSANRGRMGLPMGGSGMSQIRGEMRGPGTPVSDDIPVTDEYGEEARLADGEVVMPTDTVAAMGLQFMQRNPERAAHMLGVKLLEEQIDQTHTPADVQQARGLSIDPRGRAGNPTGNSGDVELPAVRGLSGYADGAQVRGRGLSVGRPSPYRGYGLSGHYADGNEVRGLRVRQKLDDEDDDSKVDRPSLGTGLAENAARTIEEARRRREAMLREVNGYADGRQVRGLSGVVTVNDETEEKERPSLGTGLAESAARTIEEAKRKREEMLREAMDGGYADGGQSGLGLGLSMLGHGLANAYSRGGWLQGVQAGQQSARQAEEDAFQQQQRTDEKKRQEQFSNLVTEYGEAGEPQRPKILNQMFATDPKLGVEAKKFYGLDRSGIKYGLNPVYAKDKSGNVAGYQLSESGELREIDFPEGISPAPRLNWGDLGNRRVGFDPITGKPVTSYDIKPGPTQTPDYQGAVETAKTSGRESAEAKVKAAQNLPQAEASADELMRNLDRLVTHPGLGAAVGASSLIPVVPGTSQADFVTLLDQIGGSQFLQAFQSLKGGGTITEIEGKKAEAAIARMNRRQSEEEFVKSANEFRDIVAKGIERQRRAAGVQKTRTQQRPTVATERPSLSAFRK